MSKHKSEGKKKKKGSQLVIRLEKSERDAFVTLCDALDTSAAREIRRFMREWVATNAVKTEDAAASEQPAAETPVAPPAMDAKPVDAGLAVEITAEAGTSVEPEAKPKAKRKVAVK